MKIAIVHYHMKPGGVTRIIENAAAGLESHDCVVKVFSGSPYLLNGLRQDQVIVLPELAYHGPDEAPDIEQFHKTLLDSAKKAFGVLPDVWHFHNATLGKNVALPGIILKLAQAGHRLLLQIHDLAEDGRAGLYDELRRFHHPAPLARYQYPEGNQIHYAVINGRDHQILNRAGFQKQRTHFLPNPVTLPKTGDAEEKSDLSDFNPFPFETMTLFPTRAIRRKNLGEFLLLSLFAQPGEVFVSTRAPDNPAWQSIHNDWEKLARELKLPVHLGAVQQHDYPFPLWLKAADRMVTTSIAEGFGLAFLEPYLGGKSVFGRDLPEITGDFKEEGVDLGNLYQGLYVPLKEKEKTRLIRAINNAMKATYAAYNRTMPEGAVELAIDSHTRKGRFDFGFLNESLQAGILQHCAADPGFKKQIDLDCNPALSASGEEIASNRKVIMERFSLESYTDRLMTIYQALLKGPADNIGKNSYYNGDRLLDLFLSPERFNLLRT